MSLTKEWLHEEQKLKEAELYATEPETCVYCYKTVCVCDQHNFDYDEYSLNQ